MLIKALMVRRLTPATTHTKAPAAPSVTPTVVRPVGLALPSATATTPLPGEPPGGRSGAAQGDAECAGRDLPTRALQQRALIDGAKPAARSSKAARGSARALDALGSRTSTVLASDSSDDEPRSSVLGAAAAVPETGGVAEQAFQAEPHPSPVAAAALGTAGGGERCKPTKVVSPFKRVRPGSDAALARASDNRSPVAVQASVAARSTPQRSSEAVGAAPAAATPHTTAHIDSQLDALTPSQTERFVNDLFEETPRASRSASPERACDTPRVERPIAAAATLAAQELLTSWRTPSSGGCAGPGSTQLYPESAERAPPPLARRSSSSGDAADGGAPAPAPAPAHTPEALAEVDVSTGDLALLRGPARTRIDMLAAFLQLESDSAALLTVSDETVTAVLASAARDAEAVETAQSGAAGGSASANDAPGFRVTAAGLCSSAATDHMRRFHQVRAQTP